LDRPPDKRKSAARGARGQSPEQASAEARGQPPLSLTRKLVYSLVGFLLFPLLVLVLVESGLRVAGVGQSTDFFRKERIGQEDFWVENDKFGLRFFPPELARSPSPLRMAYRKPPGTIRIFVLGESAALGDPRPAYGAARYLQVLLAARFPEGKFEVVCAAMTAINSHALAPIAHECARREGDLWILYIGNNEMIGPFGATTVFGGSTPSRGSVRLLLAMQETRLGQAVMSLLRGLKGKPSRPGGWGGMQMFLENRVRPDDPRKETVYRNFEGNLEEILGSARDARVPVLLSTVAVNLRDCAPFASLAPTNVLRPESRPFQELYAKAGEMLKQTNFSGAAEQYLACAALAPQCADVLYLLGLLKLRLGDLTSARDWLAKARDADALPFRADGRINAAIALAARKHPEARLTFLDAEGLFATNSAGGLPGREWFYEHVHFNFNGNYRLARAWAEEVERMLPGGAGNGARPVWLSQEDCDARLGLTDWNRYSVLEDVARRLSQPPFVNQLNHAEQLEDLGRQMNAVRARMDKAAEDNARAVYESAVARTPSDHRLRENYAEFLEATGQLAPALAEWEKVRELTPYHQLGYFQTGRLLLKSAKLPEARERYRRALEIRPDLAEAWMGLGQIQMLEGRPAEALKSFERQRQLAPEDHRAWYHVGRALSKLDRRTEAIKELREAVRLRPGYWEARYALGEELAFDGKVPEAQKEFEEVTRLEPGYAMAHYNLGVALAQQGRLEKAVAEVQEACRLDPANKQAAELLQKMKAVR
jgi:tetratricopeptide (TPR) repeat protein